MASAKGTSGCKVSWRGVWAGAVLGGIGNGIRGAIIGGAGGTMALPGLGTVTGAVSGGVFGFAQGFVSGAAYGSGSGVVVNLFQYDKSGSLLSAILGALGTGMKLGSLIYLHRASLK